jgi:hypothetical protein
MAQAILADDVLGLPFLNRAGGADVLVFVFVIAGLFLGKLDAD